MPSNVFCLQKNSHTECALFATTSRLPSRTLKGVTAFCCSFVAIHSDLDAQLLSTYELLRRKQVS